MGPMSLPSHPPSPSLPPYSTNENVPDVGGGDVANLISEVEGMSCSW